MRLDPRPAAADPAGRPAASTCRAPFGPGDRDPVGPVRSAGSTGPSVKSPAAHDGLAQRRDAPPPSAARPRSASAASTPCAAPRPRPGARSAARSAAPWPPASRWTRRGTCAPNLSLSAALRRALRDALLHPVALHAGPTRQLRRRGRRTRSYASRAWRRAISRSSQVGLVAAVVQRTCCWARSSSSDGGDGAGAGTRDRG